MSQDFPSGITAAISLLEQAYSGVLSKIDQITFRMLVNCLKSHDYFVVNDALTQLAKENRTIGIPPVYYTAKAHPDPRIRAQAEETLQKLDSQNEVANLVKDLDTQNAVKKLIDFYGNFRS